MTFHDVPDVDYVPDSDLLASESSFDETVENDLPFSDVPPEIGTDIQNTAPVDITPNIPIDTMDPIHASIELQKNVHFKEHEDIIHSKERESEIRSDDDNIESLTRVVNEQANDDDLNMPGLDIIDIPIEPDSNEPSILPHEHTITDTTDIDDDSDDDDDSINTFEEPVIIEDNSENGRSTTSQRHYSLHSRTPVNYALKNMGKQFLQMAQIEYPKIKNIKSTKKKAKLIKKKAKASLVIKDLFKKIVVVCFNQMSAKKGIKNMDK
jgi:hypothetical protein